MLLLKLSELSIFRAFPHNILLLSFLYEISLIGKLFLSCQRNQQTAMCYLYLGHLNAAFSLVLCCACWWQHFPSLFCGFSSFSFTIPLLHHGLPLSVLFISNVSLSAPHFFPGNAFFFFFFFPGKISYLSYLQHRLVQIPDI